MSIGGLETSHVRSSGHFSISQRPGKTKAMSGALVRKTRGAREPKSKPLVEKNKCVRFESLLTSLVPCLQRLHIFFHIFFSRGNQLGALQTPAQTPGNRYMKKPDVSGLNNVWVPAGNKNQPRSHKHLAFKTTFPYRKKIWILINKGSKIRTP